MKFSERKKHKPPAIIIISLIDILIVLLIFLMVTTTFRRAPVLNLTLPAANTASSEKGTKPPFVVTIAKEAPHLYLGLRPIAAEDLADELTSLAAGNTDSWLHIRSDEAAPYGMAVKVLDAARAANIFNINLLTNDETKE